MGRSGGFRSARLLALTVVVALAWLGAPSVVQERQVSGAAQVAPVRVPILVYHAVDYSGTEYAVTPEQLDAQMAWLVNNGYTSITVGQFWDAWLGWSTLPPNPVVLTNDDGWQSALTFAEVLGRYGMVGTYFVNNVSPLSPEQIAQLSGWGGIQAHTVTHASQAGLGYESQFAEINDNLSYLGQITGAPPRFLAWPFGASDGSAAQAAASAGITAAFGLGGTAAYTGSGDPYNLPRIMMQASDDLETFAAKVGWW